MMRRRVVIALLGWLATVALNLTTITTVMTTDVLMRAYGLGGPINLLLVLALAISAVTVAYATVGALLLSRRGTSRIGGMLLFGGAAFAAVPFGYLTGDAMSLLHPGAAWAAAILVAGSVLNGPGFAAVLPALALVFPDGRLPSSRWRPPTAVATLMLIAASLISLVRPGPLSGAAGPDNPFGIDAVPGWLVASSGALEGFGVLLLSVLGVAAVITRYRSGNPLVRRQLRWFMAAVLLAAVPFAISIQPVLGGPEWFLASIAGLLLVPVSVWIAVTRHGLYEIDRLISRGLAWALLTALLVAVYTGAVLVLQGLLASVTQGQTLAVAAAALAAAALFRPLQVRLQRTMDRRFDRARYDGDRVVVAFTERLRDQIDLDHLATDFAGVVDAALRPRDSALWLRRDR